MDNAQEVRPGQGRRAAREARTESVAIRFTKGEVETITKVAEAEGKHVSQFFRDCVLAAAERPVDDPILCELVALRWFIYEVARYLACCNGVPLLDVTAIQAMVSSKKRQMARETLQQYLKTS